MIVNYGREVLEGVFQAKNGDFSILVFQKSGIFRQQLSSIP